MVLDRIGSSVPNALLLCAGAVGAGGLFCALSFAAAGSLASFAPLFALGELGLFAIQARTCSGKETCSCNKRACMACCAAASGCCCCRQRGCQACGVCRWCAAIE